jgi:RHS repeat-associated protein
MTNESGSKVETTEYMPYGQTRSHWGSTISPYKFTDQEQDADTGLYNYGARLYDPVIGRFITADIIVQDFSDPQTFNRYSYCRNNPLIYIDPSGYSWLSDRWHDVCHFVEDIWRSEPFQMIVTTIATIEFGPIGAFGSTLAFTGDLRSATQAGVTAAITAAMFYGAGEIMPPGASDFARASIHAGAGALAGGVNAALFGGDIGLGALSGGLSAGMGSYFGNFAPFGSELLGRAIVGGVTGGSVYAMYGESFMEGFGRGAITSTYVYIYNCLLHPACFALGEGVKGDGGGNGPLIVSKRPEGFIITFPYLYRGVFFYYQKQDDGSYNFGLAVPTLENGLIVLPLTGPMKGYDPNDEG